METPAFLPSTRLVALQKVAGAQVDSQRTPASRERLGWVKWSGGDEGRGTGAWFWWAGVEGGSDGVGGLFILVVAITALSRLRVKTSKMCNKMIDYLM